MPMTAPPPAGGTAQPAAAERRVDRRYTVARAVAVRGPDGRVGQARLIELSAAGCRLAGLDGALLPVGATVSIDPGHDAAFAGTVRWAQAGYAGVVLPRPLSDDALARCVAACRTRRLPATIAMAAPRPAGFAPKAEDPARGHGSGQTTPPSAAPRAADRA